MEGKDDLEQLRRQLQRIRLAKEQTVAAIAVAELRVNRSINDPPNILPTVRTYQIGDRIEIQIGRAHV